MAGIYFEQIEKKLAVPEHYRVEVAIGKYADPSVLPADLQDREQRSQRRSVHEIAFAGEFPQ